MDKKSQINDYTNRWGVILVGEKALTCCSCYVLKRAMIHHFPDFWWGVHLTSCRIHCILTQCDHCHNATCLSHSWLLFSHPCFVFTERVKADFFRPTAPDRESEQLMCSSSKNKLTIQKIFFHSTLDCWQYRDLEINICLVWFGLVWWVWNYVWKNVEAVKISRNLTGHRGPPGKRWQLHPWPRLPCFEPVQPHCLLLRLPDQPCWEGWSWRPPCSPRSLPPETLWPSPTGPLSLLSQKTHAAESSSNVGSPLQET